MNPFEVGPLGNAIGWGYRITAVTVAVGAWYLVRHSRAHSPRPWSASAVASAALGLMHPSIWVAIAAAASVPYYALPWVGRGDDELRSFIYSAIVITLANLGLVRVLRSRRQLRGVPFCIVGFVTGGYFAFFWLWLFLQFFGAYRGQGGHGP